MKRKPLPKWLRWIVLSLYNYTCARCFKKSHLQINHKDHNPFNNDISNLEPLCLLCHIGEHPENFEGMVLFAVERYGVEVLEEI